MTTKLHEENYGIDEPKHTVATTCVVNVPDFLVPVLDVLLSRVRQDSLPRMLQNRKLSSSKDYPELPCVVAKSLITKYQRNRKCVTVKNIVLPICGDKGAQVKLVDGGLRIPALFKKEVLPVAFPKPVYGFVRSVEFFKRGSLWRCSICYWTPVIAERTLEGCVGIDRNSVGNVAVLAHPQNGRVRHLGFNPAGCKQNFRNRRAKLQSQGKCRTLRALRRKQSRRTKHENHIVSKQIVSYAVTHRRVIVVENLEGVRKPKSKIKGYVNRSQWSFYQLMQFIRYKAALRGIPVIKVHPAYTTQNCSRCGQRNTPDGKVYVCEHCSHKDHRDANAAFNIAQRGLGILVGFAKDSVSLGGASLVTPYSGGQELAYA
jgi:IS605 OrfB family transposase